MSKTQSELITKALSLINVVGAGQSPSAEDVATVEAVIEPLLAELSANGVVYVADSDAIDDSIFLPLARRLALEVAPDFDFTINDIDAAITRAENRLRRLNATQPTEEAQQATYY
jgi:hypothetical protein